MPLLIHCRCGRAFRADESSAGQQQPCPHCGAAVVIAGQQVSAWDVFVSYSSKDKVVADAAVATLESKGIRCWIAPRDIVPGSEWSEAIIEGIEQTRVLVLVFSSNSNSSQQVLREVERAVHRGMPIVPFRLEDIPASKAMEYFISCHHWLDAYRPPLQEHLEKLSGTLNVLLTGTRPPQPQAPRPLREKPKATARRWFGLERRPRLVIGLALLIVLAGSLVAGAIHLARWWPNRQPDDPERTTPSTKMPNVPKESEPPKEVPEPGVADSMDVVVLEGKSLVRYWAEPRKPWNRAGVITENATGPGWIFQDMSRTLQVVVPESNNLVHYRLVPDTGWDRAGVITTKATGPGSITQNVANGNLEVAALEGQGLVHYWSRDGNDWKSGNVISTKATGAGSIILNKSGRLQVVVPEGGNLVHYSFAPGKGWGLAEVITKNASGPGSITVNHQKPDGLELVVQEGDKLIHYWWAKTWHRGGVITTKATGPGSIIQNVANGNLEVAALEGESLVHYYRDGEAWKRGAAISSKATGPGSIIQRTGGRE